MRHGTGGGLAILALCAAGLAWLGGCESSSAAPVLGPFDSARAWEHLETFVGLGPRPAGSEALEEKRRYLVRELEEYGLEPVVERFTSETPEGPIEFANVYADVGPDTAPLVILCTHIDTKRFEWEFVGANDSAAGTAVLLELARVLARAEREVAYRVLFLDGEESIRQAWVDPDNRYGSRHHAAELQRSGERSRVKACVLLDLVGDRDLRLNRETLSNQELLGLFFEAAREAGLGQHVDGPRREIKDDHLSFMAANIPSVDLIDFEYGPRNAYWHDERDTLENVSRESLAAIGGIVLAGLPALEEWVGRR